MSPVRRRRKKKGRKQLPKTKENWDPKITSYKSRWLFMFMSIRSVMTEMTKLTQAKTRWHLRCSMLTFCLWFCPAHRTNLSNHRQDSAGKSKMWRCVKSSCFRINENRWRSRYVLGPPSQMYLHLKQSSSVYDLSKSTWLVTVDGCSQKRKKITKYMNKLTEGASGRTSQTCNTTLHQGAWEEDFTRGWQSDTWAYKVPDIACSWKEMEACIC